QGDREKGGDSVPPEILEAVRREFGIARRVLDVLVAEPSLQRPGVVAGVGVAKAATVVLHVRPCRRPRGRARHRSGYGRQSPAARARRVLRWQAARLGRPPCDATEAKEGKYDEYQEGIRRPLRARPARDCGRDGL